MPVAGARALGSVPTMPIRFARLSILAFAVAR
jgi:hypothetical protein